MKLNSSTARSTCVSICLVAVSMSLALGQQGEPRKSGKERFEIESDGRNYFPALHRQDELENAMDTGDWKKASEILDLNDAIWQSEFGNGIYLDLMRIRASVHRSDIFYYQGRVADAYKELLPYREYRQK